MARPANVFAKIQPNQQRRELVRLWKEDPHHYTRVRAHAIILSDAHYEIERIVDIYGIKRDAARDSIQRFDEGGVDALRDEDRSTFSTPAWSVWRLVVC